MNTARIYKFNGPIELFLIRVNQRYQCYLW